MSIYFIKLYGHYPPKVVCAKDAKIIKELYPNWLMYHYKASDNPVSVPEGKEYEWRVQREVIPNMRFNNHCYWKPNKEEY